MGGKCQNVCVCVCVCVCVTFDGGGGGASDTGEGHTYLYSRGLQTLVGLMALNIDLSDGKLFTAMFLKCLTRHLQEAGAVWTWTTTMWLVATPRVHGGHIHTHYITTLLYTHMCDGSLTF